VIFTAGWWLLLFDEHARLARFAAIFDFGIKLWRQVFIALCLPWHITLE